MITIDNYLDSHYIHRSNWLRAAVLGANDGIISISSLAIGIAAASSAREPIVLATVAGLVAGALSMAAGEYVSVSSQTDTEKADIEREKQELKDMPEQELNIYSWRRTSSFGSSFCTSKSYGVLSIWIYDHFSNCFRNTFCEDRRVKYKKSDYTYNNLGYTCNGVICIGWLSLRC
jgi:hypothetical protein